MSDQAKFAALGNMLSKSLDDIPDLPSYKAPPPGRYMIQIDTIAEKEINEKTAIEAAYTIVECLELSDPEEYPEEERSKPGDKFSEAFWFNDAEKVEKTISVLKAKFGALGEKLQTKNLLEILGKLDGAVVTCTITNRVDKNDKSKIYASTRDIIWAAS